MKKNLSLIGLVIALLTQITVLTPTFASSTPTVFVNPPDTIAVPGSAFTVNIDIADVEDLYGYGFKLGWSPIPLLQVINVEYGGFLGELMDPSQFVATVFPLQGYVDVGCALLGAVPGVSGDGTLATITFLVKQDGSGVLDLYDTGLLNSQQQPITPIIEQDGTVVTALPDICLWIHKKGSSRAVWTDPSWIVVGGTEKIYGKVVNTGSEGVYVRVRFDVVDSSGAHVATEWSVSAWTGPGETVIVSGDYQTNKPGTFFVKGSVYFSMDQSSWKAYTEVQPDLGGIGKAKDVDTTRFRVLTD